MVNRLAVKCELLNTLRVDVGVQLFKDGFKKYYEA